MTNGGNTRQSNGVLWFVLGAVAAAICLFGIIRTLTVTDSSVAAGGIVGALFWAAIAVVFFVVGSRKRRRN
jgi:hypothetical protein